METGFRSKFTPKPEDVDPACSENQPPSDTSTRLEEEKEEMSLINDYKRHARLAEHASRMRRRRRALFDYLYQASSAAGVTRHVKKAGTEHLRTGAMCAMLAHSHRINIPAHSYDASREMRH